jgi:hypothetical protein
MGTMKWGFNNDGEKWWKHYEKSCLFEPHCLVIRVPKQLLYNYTTIKTWKYGQLRSKMPSQNQRVVL